MFVGELLHAVLHAFLALALRGRREPVGRIGGDGLGDVVEFPQNGFGTSEKRIRESPDEVYRMVRATLRGLQFVWDKNNQEAVTSILMKQWKVNDRKMAGEMSRQVSRVLTRDAYVKPESVQVLVDLARENAKVTKPVSAAEVVDYTFLDKARKELGITK